VRSYNFLIPNQGSSALFPSLLKALLRVDDEGAKDDEDHGSEVAVGLEACCTDQVIPLL
jgi:hypothetical protein